MTNETTLLDSVVGVWRDVFATRVEPGDDFFELGGQSALAVRIAARIRDRVGLDVPASAVLGAGTPARLAALLADGGVAAGPSVRVEATRMYPLTASQERMWWIDNYIPNVSGFHTRTRLEFEGYLEVSALTMSLTDIIRRHEVLRSRFDKVDGVPMQIVCPYVELDFEELSLEGLESAAQKAEIERLSVEQATRRFDLVNEPVLRTLLVRCAPDRHMLLAAAHHIAFDGWSRDVFVRELAEHYTAHASGTTPSPPEPPIQFGDFAVWQREYYTDAVLDEHLDYWRRQLAGELKPIELRAGGPPGDATFKSSDTAYAIAPEAAGDVARLSRAQGASVFMTLLAAFKVVLHSYSGERDIRVASLVANRVWPDTEDLIGLFSNIVVIRTHIDLDERFSDLLRRVRETALAAYGYQGLPFETVLRALDLSGTLDRRALLQFGFAVHVPSPLPYELPSVRMRLIRELAQTDGETLNPSTFDLTLEMVETDAAYVGRIEYSRDAFSEELVAQLVRDLERVVARIARAPDASVRELIAGARRAPVPVASREAAKGGT